MKIAFCLYKYFPFGGLERDFLRTAKVCLERGHEIDMYVREWQGEIPAGFNVNILPVLAITNHGSRESFINKLRGHLSDKHYDVVVGFNKMPGLDVYYAADTCYAANVKTKRLLYRMTARYRSNLRLEQAVFGKGTRTKILAISKSEKERYQQYYGTEEDRFHFLPPGISRDRLAPENAKEGRSDLRSELAIGEDQNVVLMVGTGFRRKGVNRSIRAMSALPPGLREKTILLVVGKDKPGGLSRLAKQLGVTDQVRFLGGREDVPRFLTASDLLVHPAYLENTGTILIEAMAAELPVLVTDVCGYSFHIERAGAGEIVPSPFRQETLDQLLAGMLTSDKKELWKKNCREYVANNDIFSLPEKAADVIERAAAC